MATLYQLLNKFQSPHSTFPPTCPGALTVHTTGDLLTDSSSPCVCWYCPQLHWRMVPQDIGTCTCLGGWPLHRLWPQQPPPLLLLWCNVGQLVGFHVCLAIHCHSHATGGKWWPCRNTIDPSSKQEQTCLHHISRVRLEFVGPAGAEHGGIFSEVIGTCGCEAYAECAV